MSCYTRLLTLKDLDQITELYSQHSMHMSIYRDDFTNVHVDDVLVNEYLNPQYSKKELYGTFVNDELVLSMGIFFWQSMPSCTFLRFVSRKRHFTAKSMREPFRQLYSACLDRMEQLGYNKFYLLSAAKHQLVFAYLGATWDPFQTKYMMAIEEVIPSNTRSKFEIFWDLMGRKTWPIPLIVRSGTLLNSHRKFEAKFVNPRTLKIWDAANK